MDTLIVTGAGASRNLGTEGSTMPLMRDWAGTLCEALDAAESGLAKACRLDPEFDGPQFEQALGELLEWDQVRPLEEKFEALALHNFTGVPLQKLRQARANTSDRLAKVRSAIHETLYRQFSHVAVDDAKAIAAYSSLLDQLRKPRFAIATTNYDRSAESALLQLGYSVVNGFVGNPPRRKVFKPSSLAEMRGKGVTLLHLHGAVGWYERNGEVVLDNADEDHDDSRGSPVVLYPDPGKKPSENVIVAEIWQELEFAVQQAKRVVVIGHSLHDQPLVGVLRKMKRGQKLAVSYFDPSEQKRVQGLLPHAMPFKLDFTPDARLSAKVLNHLGIR
ncbi:MAG TPA: SIR2 family protein [Solirubrobacterales bacterium]|nr:SIR2 family protein [Solirubrobacterales bacterium]